MIAVQCQYKASTTFNDRVDVAVSVRGYRGPRLTIGYEMRKEDGTLVLTGESEHCFLDREGKFLRLAKVLPELTRPSGPRRRWARKAERRNENDPRRA